MAAPLIGRADARAVIRDALADTVAGRGGVLWLSGEAGIGKTRLLAELATLADAGGGVVLRGAGWEDPAPPRSGCGPRSCATRRPSRRRTAGGRRPGRCWPGRSRKPTRRRAFHSSTRSAAS